MQFDWTINIGTLASAVTGAGTVLWAVVRYGIKLHKCLENRLDAHGERLCAIEQRQRATRKRMRRMHTENTQRLVALLERKGE